MLATCSNGEGDLGRSTRWPHLRQLLVGYFRDLEERDVIVAEPARKLKMPKDVRDRDPRPRTLASG